MCFTDRAGILAPVSSPSWNANTQSGQPVHARDRCEPDRHLTRQPVRSSAAGPSTTAADSRGSNIDTNVDPARLPLLEPLGDRA
jgi:hypothetical protein